MKHSLFIILLLLQGNLFAQSLTVNTVEDQLDTPRGAEISLREALRDIGTNQFIVFNSSLSGSTIELTLGTLLIDRPLKIDGSSLAEKITIDAQELSRVFEVSDATFSPPISGGAFIESIIIENGKSPDGLESTSDHESASGLPGAGILNSGRLTLTDCEFANNTTGNGGYYTVASVSDETTASFGGNGGNGGAIANNGSLVIEGCVFADNRTGAGGDGLSAPDNTSSSLLPDYFGSSGNGGSGGAIYNSGFIELNACSLLNNSTGMGGRGSGTEAPEDFFPINPNTGDPEFEYMSSGDGGSGGAIYNEGTFHISHAQFIQNNTGSGGTSDSSISNIFDPITGQLLTLKPGPGATGGDGGGLHNSGEISVKNSTFWGNHTGNGGCGIERGNFDPITGAPLDTLASGGGDGGAISNAGAATLVSITFANNRTGNGGYSRDLSSYYDPITGLPIDCDKGKGGPGGHGGAIHNTDELTLIGSTLYQNNTGNGGAGLPDGVDSSKIETPPITAGVGGRGGDGGAIWNSNICTISSNTFFQNSTGRAGISFGDSCTTFDPITGLPISGSAVQEGSGGGVFHIPTNVTSALTIRDSIIANNSSFEAGPDILSYFNLVTSGANIITDLSSSNLSPAPSVIVANPRLAPFDYYGQSIRTMPPLPGSPAIDSAGPPFRDVLDLDDDNRNSEPTPFDQRGLTRTAGIAADIGAVELQDSVEARSILSSLWTDDTDNDGSPFGVEFAFGSDPFAAASPEARDLNNPTMHESGEATLSFGIDAAVAPYTTWILKRSTTLAPETFQEIYRLDGPAMMETLQPGIDSAFTPIFAPTSVTITDQTPPSGKAYYRFEAELSPEASSAP